MGVHGVGIDMVPVGSVAESLHRFGERYVAKVFTAHEAAWCERTGGCRAGRYAARFAAKEAVMKVLGTSALSFTEVEIRTDAAGRPAVALHGRATARAAACGLGGFLVSMSHHDGYAVAAVIGLGGPHPAHHAGIGESRIGN